MPIMLDSPDLFLAAATKVGPKYFDKMLTGEGKNRGLISTSLKPRIYPKGHNRNTIPTTHLDRKLRQHNGSVTTNVIPMAPLRESSLYSVINTGNATNQMIAMPDKTEMFHLTEDNTGLDFELWFAMSVQGLIVVEDSSGDRIERTINVGYRMEAFCLEPGTNPKKVSLPNGRYNTKKPYVTLDWTFAPLSDAQTFVENILDDIPNGNAAIIDYDALQEWLSTYDVHEAICNQAEIWSTDAIVDVISNHVDAIFTQGNPSVDALNALAEQFRYLESYPVALESYRAIHNHLTKTIPTDELNQLVKQNLNLLMSHTLDELDSARAALPSVPLNGASKSIPVWASTQQRNAISAEEPLVLVQAGAGVGKSTVILERIQYMIAAGVDPADITVLSFTNAAADHIKEANPGVNSMTTARMIHDIYSLNHPTHELSSIDTIINSLDIYFPTDDIAMTFRRRLIEMKKKAAFPAGTTALNAFVEYYQTQVIEILNRIGQTCLELEIILAYQQINTMIEPAHVKAQHLIIDEVQDNSVFEFIYALKYAAKNKTALYLVGDSSQTLYEFRASNPKALNALEESGVFATYSLTTNYRSNQAILDFANRALLSIESNQYARIQLQANQMGTPTPKEFTEKVTLDYRQLARPVSDFKTYMPAYMKNVIRPWIDKALARGEKVAFLAYDRATVTSMQQTLLEMYPGKEIISLVSERAYSTTIFSDFVKEHWNEVRQVPDLSQAPFAITAGIQAHQPAHKQVNMNSIMRMLSEWWTASRDAISSWVMLARAGQLTDDEFFERLKRNVIEFEISRNAIKQSLLNQRNKQRKEKNLTANAELIVSTIHGAKGLEFDNVVIMYRAKNNMDEADKRMYYVALTRAINQEYILAYESLKNPKIVSDYELVVADLIKAQKLEALRAQGTDPALLAEDEVEAALALLEQRAKDAFEAGDTDTAMSLVAPELDFSTTGADLSDDVIQEITEKMQKAKK